LNLLVTNISLLDHFYLSLHVFSCDSKIHLWSLKYNANNLPLARYLRKEQNYSSYFFILAANTSGNNFMQSF